MDKQLIILILLIILFILTCVYISKNNTESFQDGSTKPVSLPNDITDISNVDNLFNMFASLEEIEKKCEQIEENDELYNDKINMKHNDRVFKELEEQDVKINELKDIVKYLTIEKKRKDNVNNKCREKNQIKLNENYSLLKKLNNDGLAKDNQMNLDLNVSDALKINMDTIKQILNKNKTNTSTNKNCKKSPKDSTNIDNIKLDNKCYGCVNSKIKKNYNHIMKDFKQ